MLQVQELAELGVSRSFPALAASVRPAREMLAGYARDLGATPEQAESIRLVVSEAVTNAVLHAYPAADGEVHVGAYGQSGQLWLQILDDGVGLRVRPDSPGMGLGLVVIAAMADELSIRRRASGGTELLVRFTIGEAHPPLHQV